jgi:hypothetical protein
MTMVVTIIFKAGEYLFCGTVSSLAIRDIADYRTARYSQNAFERMGK